LSTEQNNSALKPLLVLAAVAVLLAIGVSGWAYFSGKRTLRVQARELNRALAPGPGNELTGNAVEKADLIKPFVQYVEGWAKKISFANAAAGIGLTAIMLVGASLWQRHTRQSPEELPQVQKLRFEMQTHLKERRRAEAEMNRLREEMDKQVQERTAVIEKTYSKLQVELNERKQSERTLAHQRQELERSKDVLELHVQVFHRVAPSASGRTPQTAFIAKDGGHATEQLFHRKDGSSFPVEYVRTPILENNRQMGAVVIFKDITERKRAEETLARKAAELARSNGELEQFAYVASHDLQEPLRKIRAFGDRLKAKMDEGDVGEGREYLERMQSAAARMQTLINDLLTFSRVISTTEAFVPLDLAAVTREVLGDLEVRIEQTKAKIEVGDLPTIDADPMQMRQLLQNVIGNALKFQAPKAAPVVKITAEIVRAPFSNAAEPTADDEVCLLSVQDNGIGFEEKYMDKIFAMFGRLHGRSEYEGTGVGLAVCRRITDRHSGTITAKSKPGEGATFIIRLPVRQRKQEELQQAA